MNFKREDYQLIIKRTDEPCKHCALSDDEDYCMVASDNDFECWEGNAFQEGYFVGVSDEESQ